MTEHNIFQEIEEDLQRQKWEDLWKCYGKYVVATAFAIVLVTAAITEWHAWRAAKNQQATAGLIGVISQGGANQAKQIEALEAFAQKNHGATQAVFAQLHAAALAAKGGDRDKAVKIYDSVVHDGRADPVFRQLADLMAVEAQIDSGSPEVLEKRLQPLTADNAPWRFTAMEYQGYLAMRAGDKAKAAQIFTELSQNASAPRSLSARAADMLRYVSD